ncbi:ABC-F family ATP-binding cassette domain-containing protein [Mesoplasma lactucae]|uniref:ABC transporter ATP-binding protein n=1 Tax=Mesoplasma lactucae ATCC 49193 TaxID=81460 RepID=A0A291IS05_9MOLU|nr:ABC-F family ATP-binding cassette domain-containing protein [Mesoplasma lactucae]ATG97715.1 ABC transporter ATP-binding protein [Mesoplasma lactucae ATCC 49193]ATZ20510.1 ABC transporter ATP-binding protein [Mesoplasma lactucae ATCC 49193]MCL8216681.1 putative ABC transporter ATP-binding protein YheS [Mesoplasma lactucae ATCC 49193]
MSIVFVENLSHANGDKLLYKDSTLRVNKGEHVALLGANGAGKTTLLNLISGKDQPDHGTIEIHPKAKMGYLDQHQDVDMSISSEDYLKGAFADLYKINDQIQNIYQEMAIEYKEEDLVKALALQEELDLKGFDTIDKQIGNLVSGLGIDPENMNKKLGQLSGGQRGKILLARLLLQNDDFILLDEPTNFLDIEQVEWLARFLQSYENSFLLVSHDNDFINKTVDIIYAIENQQINRYVGNYEKYLELSELRKEQYDKAVVSQQQQIAKLQEYVNKNKARASTAKSAQSRQKQLDKMNVLEERKDLVKPNMSFKYKRPAASVVAEIQDLEIGYDFPLLQNPLNFELREGEKAIVKGYNGIGKTTFLKTLAGEIKPIDGKVELGNGVEVAFFHQVEHAGDETPVQFLKREYPNMLDGEIRATIGRFGIKSNLMNNPMKLLSGGEQTKVRLAALSLVPSSLLILDEPTNHIDVLAKEALLEAINAFEGTVLLTTHDINFETNWADKVLNFEDLV